MTMNLQLVDFISRSIQTKSFSDDEGAYAQLILEEMKALGFDEAFIDQTGNVVGRMGNGPKIIHFDGHMDTVEVHDEQLWKKPPFSGLVEDGFIWGRGSVDMKSALCASVYSAALAKELGYLEGKTVYISGTVCEEFCDGESLKLLYSDLNIKPDYCIICEPSDNVITLGHKGKAQIRIKTHGISAHGSAPEKGINAVYEMAELIQRVERLNASLRNETDPHGTVVLSDISSISASLNAVPSECSIYLDRRLALGETLEQVESEMNTLVAGKRASWEIGTLNHKSWTGRPLSYDPMHSPWRIEKDHALTVALIKAYETVYGASPKSFDFWDFGTNAVTPIALGIPTIGFGPGEYKLAHMVDERCSVKQIEEACEIYAKLIALL